MGRIFELGAADIEQLLETALIGRIACSGEDSGRPYLVPMGFGYDGEAIYAISGPGRKIDLMRAQPMVAFEVDRGTAEDQWQSVVADGTYEEVTDANGLSHALNVLFGEGPYPEIGPHSIVFRIVLTRKSGRYEVPDESPVALG